MVGIDGDMAAPVDADDAHLFEKRQIRGQFGDRACGKPNHEESAARRKRSKSGFSKIASHGIVDHIERSIAQVGLERVSPVRLAVIDQEVRPLPACHV